MGPGIAVLLPEWPPRQLLSMKERFSSRASRFSVESNESSERWHLRLGDEPDAPEVSVVFRVQHASDLALSAALNWQPKGVAELYGFKRPEIRPTVRALSELAHEVAERLGGVVKIDGPGPVSPEAPGRLFEVEGEYYADAKRYEWLKEQVGYEIAGFPAV